MSPLGTNTPSPPVCLCSVFHTSEQTETQWSSKLAHEHRVLAPPTHHISRDDPALSLSQQRIQDPRSLPYSVSCAGVGRAGSMRASGVGDEVQAYVLLNVVGTTGGASCCDVALKWTSGALAVSGAGPGGRGLGLSRLLTASRTAFKDSHTLGPRPSPPAPGWALPAVRVTPVTR